MLALLLPLLASADPGHAPGPTDAVEITWDGSATAPPAGTVLWVAVPQVRPCAAPMGACSAAPLRAGQAVVVTAVGDSGSPTNRPSRWLQVAPAGVPAAADEEAKAEGPPVGWVLAHQLSGASWSLDLDGDGELERVVVRFSDAPRVEAHVVEANGSISSLDLKDAQDIDGPQLAGTVRVVPEATAGLPLIHMNWSAREMCGSGDYSRYASYRSPGPGKAGTLQVALEHGGSGSDAPIWYETSIAFDGKGAAVVHKRAGEYLDDGGESVHHDEKTTHRLDPSTGVFTKVVSPSPSPSPSAPVPPAQ